ncbi:acetolactate synthase-1/2/3 large subunit [Saccharothrix tamanrassetensis]|uniref:Acetolactate synthase-1/2/3 large subunit n=1 Tax=Saccharothrix tamanrassetensis TaxID=1051531 RepID=A0A841CG19_9PSEU|nr:thiamine pyrophosphate-binding protein [Saccharothrix tamanrassetensis]MBB5955933.1 acetolactate synthase-1/2/3 large subunit [Saccharothrix tamanrassetensis]
MASGAVRLLEVLGAHGVEVVFGLPGVHNLPVWEALRESRIRLVGVRHEQTAVYAADGYARATGKLGVALVTTGPGAANCLAATGEAMASGSPVLVVATDIPSTLRRPGEYRGVLHETRDQRAMFLPVVKGGWTLRSADVLGTYADSAALLATTAPHGPVYLGIPTDFLTADAGPWSKIPTSGQTTPALDHALDLVSRSGRPLIWAGGGAQRAGAGPAVAELAERLDAPIVTTYGARGLVDHPLVVHGPVHLPEVGALWDDADLVIGIGSDFDGMMTQNWLQPPPHRLISINVDTVRNYPPDVTLRGDARLVAEALVRALPRRADPTAAERVAALNALVRRAIADDEPRAVPLLEALEGHRVVADMCVAGYWVGGFHKVTRPRGLAYPVGWGTLGFGFPAALGAAVAGRTVAVCGDGGFLFACGDLATARQEQLPVTVVLVDDGGYGMLRYDQVEAGHPPHGVDLHTPDFVGLARSFDVEASEVDGFGDEFASRLREFTNRDGPNMIVVRAALRPPPNTSPRWYRKVRT